MKKTLIILIAFFGIYSFVDVINATNNIELKTENNITFDKENISENDMWCDYECPDDDCFSGCLYSTYKTEYCVGLKCRDRTLYKCNINSSHKYWIYHD
tara:strand:+ start:375 stop:671 length:297 start_codon:yes stop_codon:yes gene_type:complete